MPMRIYLLNTFLSNLILAAIFLVQNEDPTMRNRGGVTVTARITRFIQVLKARA